MTAGYNLRINIWRTANSVDDEVGGAVLTEYLAYRNVTARISPAKPDMLLLQQGYETEKVFTCICRPASMKVLERDEIEIASPPNHRYIHDRFRVTGVQYVGLHPSDSRGYILLTMSRSERSHLNQ